MMDDVLVPAGIGSVQVFAACTSRCGVVHYRPLAHVATKCPFVGPTQLFVSSHIHDVHSESLETSEPSPTPLPPYRPRLQTATVSLFQPKTEIFATALLHSPDD